MTLGIMAALLIVGALWLLFWLLRRIIPIVVILMAAVLVWVHYDKARRVRHIQEAPTIRVEPRVEPPGPPLDVTPVFPEFPEGQPGMPIPRTPHRPYIQR